MPRVELSCSARLHHEGRAAPGSVVNISQGGICLTTRATLPINADVIVTLPGLKPAAGVVKWSENDQYGIGFNRVFPVSDLMCFLQEKKSAQKKRALG